MELRHQIPGDGRHRFRILHSAQVTRCRSRNDLSGEHRLRCHAESVCLYGKPVAVVYQRTSERVGRIVTRHHAQTSRKHTGCNDISSHLESIVVEILSVSVITRYRTHRELQDAERVRAVCCKTPNTSLSIRHHRWNVPRGASHYLWHNQRGRYLPCRWS